MKKNVGSFDGFFRIVLGMMGFVAVILFNWWWGLIGLIFIGTAFSLYCPLYDVLDINTNKDEAERVVGRTKQKMTKSILEKSTCYHCGENCDGSLILYNEKPFCCDGCKAVYQILQDNNLCEFYDIQDLKKGLSKKGAELRYDYLDDEAVAAKLIRFKNATITKVEFYLPAIHCSACLWLLENLYKIDSSIVKSTVNFSLKEVYITFDNSKTTLRKVAELLDKIGYPPSITFDTEVSQDRSNHIRRYYYKIGVAFFCFGNIMLFSFPEYFGLKGIIEDHYRHFFAYLNFMLALPVMFYSATEFFQSAWNAVRQRTMNMDIPIVLGIVAMFIRSSFEIFSQTGVGYMDTLASLVMLMLIGRWFQNKTPPANKGS